MKNKLANNSQKTNENDKRKYELKCKAKLFVSMDIEIKKLKKTAS